MPIGFQGGASGGYRTWGIGGENRVCSQSLTFFFVYLTDNVASDFAHRLFLNFMHFSSRMVALSPVPIQRGGRWRETEQ